MDHRRGGAQPAAFLVGQVAGDTRNSLFSLLLLAVSYPLYRVARKAERAIGR